MIIKNERALAQPVTVEIYRLYSNRRKPSTPSPGCPVPWFTTRTLISGASTSMPKMRCINEPTGEPICTAKNLAFDFQISGKLARDLSIGNGRVRTRYGQEISKSVLETLVTPQ